MTAHPPAYASPGRTYLKSLAIAPPMIKTPVTLILGAGASKPYGFPTGKELIDDIANLHDKPQTDLPGWIGGKDNTFDLDLNRLWELAKRLKFSDPISIDDFLKHNRHLLDIGKTAIACHIAYSEKPRKLREPNYNSGEHNPDHWYPELWHRLIDGLTEPDQIADNALTIITFNYDRSLEHYLFHNIGNHFHGLKTEDIANLAASIPVYHVHGTIAPHPYYNTEGVSFAKAKAPGVIHKSKQHIHVIHEKKPDTVLQQACNALLHSDNIGCLGFGFHLENTMLLGMDSLPSGIEPINATAYNLTQRECARIKETTGVAINFTESEYRCLDFLRNTSVL